jgi:hypothetical protein
MRRWRWFFLATAGLFGYAGGSEWGSATSSRNSFYFCFWEAAVGDHVRASSRETPPLHLSPRLFFGVGSRTTVRRSTTPAHLGGMHDSI